MGRGLRLRLGIASLVLAGVVVVNGAGFIFIGTWE
jgi:hypothetical protein